MVVQVAKFPLTTQSPFAAQHSFLPHPWGPPGSALHWGALARPRLDDPGFGTLAAHAVIPLLLVVQTEEKVQHTEPHESGKLPEQDPVPAPPAPAAQSPVTTDAGKMSPQISEQDSQELKASHTADVGV